MKLASPICLIILDLPSTVDTVLNVKIYLAAVVF